MTPEEQFKLLRETSKEIADAVLNAFEELLRLIRGGEAPVDAVRKVMDTFTGEFAEIMQAGLSVVIGESVGDAMAIRVGDITLSTRLYSQAEKTSTAVQKIVTDHTRGFQDARKLALELYEGYGFNPEETLDLNQKNEAIPKYMREALLRDPGVKRDLSKAYARAQTKALRGAPLKAAYNELLDAIQKVEDGAGQELLDKKLWVAFNEKMRHYANRIAETELHRAYAESQASEIMADTDVEYVEWRLSPMHPVEDICDYFAGVDKYGLGPGIYPKALAPVAPAHPFCKCVLVKRFDIRKEPELTENADDEFFAKQSPVNARKIAGSEKKLERVKNGETAWNVHNSNTDPIYQVKTVSDVAS